MKLDIGTPDLGVVLAHDLAHLVVEAVLDEQLLGNDLMDARLDVYRLAGLELGEAHVIRNAGGVISDDVVRSLVISQRLLGTDHIVLIHHTDCGMLTFEDDSVKDQITAETGIRPTFALEAFKDPAADVRQSIARIEASPFIPHKNVRGFVSRNGRTMAVKCRPKPGPLE